MVPNHARCQLRYTPVVLGDFTASRLGFATRRRRVEPTGPAARPPPTLVSPPACRDALVTGRPHFEIDSPHTAGKGQGAAEDAPPMCGEPTLARDFPRKLLQLP